ncbi:ATPase GET3C-like [Magnolia sinica]|uniref:ATPase GET3C-like n=1 Tax=Magnolia sinica TaxID=86752 RepID=UPI0026589D69|nr:ATPase GET3C-like [Magnolia sinica]
MFLLPLVETDACCLTKILGVSNELIIILLQINPEKAREEFRSSSQKNGGTGVKDFMDSVGLGMFVEQVMQFVEAQEYNMFSHIVFDTAPTMSKLASIYNLFATFSLNPQTSLHHTGATQHTCDHASGRTLRMICGPKIQQAD